MAGRRKSKTRAQSQSKRGKRTASRSNGRPSADRNQLLAMELQQIQSAETQLTRMLPRLAKPVQSEELKQMLDQRLEQGEQLLEELDSVLEELGERTSRKRNVAAEGLLNDAREHVQELRAGPALDAALIASIQKTEHYCIAAWGTARSLAQASEQKSAVKTMERVLKEGKEMDEQLTQLAENEIYPQLSAEEASGEEDEGDEDEEDGEQATRRGRARRGSGSERRQST